MATIGLDNLVYCEVTDTKTDTYGTVKPVLGAKEADISPDVQVKEIFLDDGSFHKSIRRFRKAQVTLNVDDLEPEVIQDWLGCKIDNNGALIYSADDKPKTIAIGFRSMKDNGEYRYVWLYKGTFQLPQETSKTLGDNIDEQSKTIVGTFVQRVKDKNWKTTLDSDSTIEGAAAAIKTWFTKPYEPTLGV